MQHDISTETRAKYARLVKNALTPQQRVVLSHIAEGLNNPQIAAKMFIAEGTVGQVTSAIYRLCGLQGRSECVES